MDQLWNLWDVKPPPVITVKTDLQLKEISCLREVACQMSKTLSSTNILNQEAAILSRFLYKKKRMFRHDKGFQILSKINQCLKRYLKLDMNTVALTFNQSLPHKVLANVNQAFLPTRQMLKWVLLRLQAFSQIFCRIIKLSKEVGVHFYQKMCLGWSLNLSLLIFSMTGRLLASSKYLVAKSIEWYSCFYRYLHCLKETADFLPDYKFPSDLKLWLGDVDLTPLKKDSFVDEIFEYIDLAKDNDKDDDIKVVKEKLFKNLFKVDVLKLDEDAKDEVEEIIIDDAKEEKKGVKRPLTIQLEDTGVPVVEEDDSKSFKKKMKKRKK